MMPQIWPPSDGRRVWGSFDLGIIKAKFQLPAQRRIIIGAILAVSVVLLFTSWKLYAADNLLLHKLPPPSQTGFISTEKAAVIVENRALENLVPVILHFSSVLGPDWPIHVFTSEESRDTLLQSSAFQRHVEAGRFHIKILPEGTSLKTHATISDFYTQPWFWEQLAPAEHLLLFQADSIICSNSPQKVEDYFQYDFVGAPVDESRGLGKGFNGGLSLRSRSKCLQIVNDYDWQVARHGNHGDGNVDYEDQWFSKMMRETGANLPSKEVAMTFAVETMWYDTPLGYHQPSAWQKDRMEEIYKWCPEYRMCTTETFTDHNPEDFASSGGEV